MAITRLNDFRAATGRHIALREFLQSVISTIKAAKGCRAVELLVDQEDAAHLVIVETWDDVAAHQAAAKLIPPAQLADVGALLAEPPKGRFYDLA